MPQQDEFTFFPVAGCYIQLLQRSDLLEGSTINAVNKPVILRLVSVALNLRPESVT